MAIIVEVLEIYQIRYKYWIDQKIYFIYRLAGNAIVKASMGMHSN